jgi:hypothetical protein
MKLKKVKPMKECVMATCAVVALLLPLAGILSFGQNAPKPAQTTPETIQCSVQGTGTRTGSIFSIKIVVNEYSPETDRRALAEAFVKDKSQGLYNVLTKMPSKGRLSVPGAPGYDLKFIRLVPDTPPGTRKIRIITDRPITVGESMRATRSMDYSLTAIELDLSDVKGKSAGVLMPLCEFAIDKQTKELKVEAYKDPWKLFNFFGDKKK